MPRIAALDPAPYALPAELRARLLSPALVVFLDAVRHNLSTVLERCGGDPERWRPHVKTTKIPEVWAELAHVGVRSFKCATTREAGCLGALLEAERVDGADVLLAHPLVGPGMAELGRVARAHPAVRFSVLCEAPEAIDEAPGELGLFLDLNPGMDRTGVPLARRDDLRALARRAGGRLRGLHYYDGHRHDADPVTRRERACAGYGELLELVAALAADGLRVPELVTSGTPTFGCALDYAPFARSGGPQHRVSPGTVVFHDVRTEEQNPELDLLPAALVLARVASHPAPELVTCDAGSKALAAEAGDPCALVLGRPELEARTPNEEHLPLRVHAGPPPARGAELLLVPRHVCPTVNLAEQAVLIDGGRLRGVVAVQARAHDLLTGS